MATPEQCKKLLFNIGIKYGISPKLISTRLLSDEDKADMMSWSLSEATLVAHVLVWKEAGMPDYANGNLTPYVPKGELPMSRYRGNGV